MIKLLKWRKKWDINLTFFARNLSTPFQIARSNVIAILISDFSNPYQSYLFETLSSVLQAEGKIPMLMNVAAFDDISEFNEVILRLSGYQVDGVIAVVGSLPPESLNQCLKLSLPVVMLGRSDNTQQLHSIQTDNVCAGQLAAQHFLAKGLTKLAFVMGRLDGQASLERQRGFVDTLLAAGITAVSQLNAGGYGYDAGFKVATHSAQVLGAVQGVFCASDALAFGLIDSCRTVNSIKIPEQLHVIGCDNVPMAAWQGYQLTTVEQPVQNIAQMSVHLLERMCKGENITGKIHYLKPIIKVRNT